MRGMIISSVMKITSAAAIEKQEVLAMLAPTWLLYDLEATHEPFPARKSSP